MGAAMSDRAMLSLDDEIERKLLEHRRLFFSDGVDMRTASDAIRKLWFMELEDPGKPITLFINSPGGSVDAGFAVWDQCNMISSPITTVVTGIAASMGSILSLCGERGRRFATPYCRIMIHQPAVHGGLFGQATDLEIHARQILITRDKIVDLYSEATGQKKKDIARAIDRDTWLSAKEAKDFGLIDEIVTSFQDLKS